MLNKNDPLIGAVQQVMQQSNAEREAVKVVNEKFGIQDRKALPHEYQAEWNSVYQQVLSEATDPSKYSEKQKRFAATAGNKKVIDGPDLTHVRKYGGKHIEEEQLDEKKMSDAQMKKREEILKSMKRGMSGFKKRYGERAKDVMYATATKQAMSEGWGDQPGSPLDRIKKYFGFGGSSSPETKTSSAPKYDGNVKYTPKSAESQRAASTTGQGKARQQAASITPGGTSSSAGQQTGSGTTAPKPPKPTAKPADLNTTPKVKKKVAPKAATTTPKATRVKTKTEKEPSSYQRREARQRVLAGKEGVGPEANRLRKISGVKLGVTVRQPARKTLKEQIADIIAEKAMGAMVAQQQAQQNQQKRPSSPMPVSGEKNTSWFSRQTDMQRATKDMGKMDKLRRMQSNPPALDATQKTVAQSQAPMRQAQNRQDLAKSVQAGRAGTNTALNRAPASSGVSGNPMGDYNPGQEYSTPTSPQSQAQSNMTPTVKTRPDLPVARKKAEPIKVSDTEVMNDPKFKKAVSSVGGTQAAKKIQTGERVAGLGRFNKGDTIMSRVRTDIAARKNVGRES